jgi:Flp pilus assembly protein TadG
LLSDQAGNTAIVFGLIVVPVLALGGGVVDLSHRADVRAELQSAADTAALAAARSVQSGMLQRGAEFDVVAASARTRAERLFGGTLAAGSEAAAARPTVDVTDGTVRVSASIDVPTSFLTLIGIPQLGADALAEVNLPDLAQVEIALVLDYSRSMLDNDKYRRMTTAARSFIDRIGAERSGRSKIGIVPFSEYVYAEMEGGDLRESGDAGDSDSHDDHGGGGGWGGGWSGGSGGGSFGSGPVCLLNRDYPYSAGNEPPSSGLPASQWPTGNNSRCEGYEDGDLEVRDLTDDFEGLSSALAGMEPVGLTNIALATEMGWHVLSPGRPFETARDYSEPHLEKIMILLTDGVQTVNAMGPSGEVSTLAADEVTAEACDNAATEGIRIYTIAYDIEDQRVRDLLEGCASSARNYFEAETNDISAVFDEIFSQMQQSVWLSR